MRILRQPEPEADLTPFYDGVAAIKQNGKVVGHIATSVSTFWSPFNPFSLNWWVWSVIVWADGTKETKLEDYAPWSYVEEMKHGRLEWDDIIYDIEWLAPDKAQSKYKELNIQPDDF